MRAVPTDEMLKAGGQEYAMTHQRVQTAEASARDIYRAMLAAAPAPVDGLVERLRICASSMEDVANTKNIEGWATLLEHVDVIREAAAALQSSDEPVAWFYTTGLGVNAEMSNNRFSHGPKRPDERAGWIPLYATPPRKP